jgi:F0F1-type ATP synthase assembly protein I
MPHDDELLPFRWGDCYDLAGIVVGVGIGVMLVAVGASVWLAITFGCPGVNLTSFALRRRAGIPQLTLFESVRRRWARRRRP